ncbi:hypothetical protein [Nostoc sp.]|uniref:hypothetical protein n=1 Tax=Nostoc sp. TaxID=1180 RepID=UPI002FF638ED
MKSKINILLLQGRIKEVGSRKSEVGSRKSEVGSRKSEVGSRTRYRYEERKYSFVTGI